MKIVLIYRRRREGGYSIEELFHSIAGELRKRSEVIEYEMGTRWTTITDVWRLRQMKADIYHVTGDINYLAMLLPHKKTVLTVLDIGHYLYGLRGFKRWIYKWLWLIWPIRMARAVTVISKKTRDNIGKYLPVEIERIEVIECCHSPIFEPVPLKFNGNCPVILQVGTSPWKNVHRLVEALKGIKCRLVLVGRLDGEVRQKLVEFSVDYVNHVNLSHEELFKQYVECDIVSFISTHEGFGVPIIEAQACGRPVVTSNISPMNEVAGNGACLVDPLNVAQIREGILRIIADPIYRNQLAACGLQNVDRYSPTAISEKYLGLYSCIT